MGLYRSLVRRLHPDTRTFGDSQTMALWHEVQQAYEARDEERLEILSTMTNLHFGKVDENTSLWHIRGVLQELKRSCRKLQAELRKARRNPEWGFATQSDHRKLEKATNKKLQSELKDALADKEFFANKIERWKKSANSPARRKKESKRVLRKQRGSAQDGFAW